MSRATKTLKGVFLSIWGGGKTTLLTVVVALSLATLTPAFGATGGNFILGKSNVATTISNLTANVAGAPALQIVNNNTAPGSKALALVVAQGRPPMTVNPTAGKALNLNADKVDGSDAPLWAVVDSGGLISPGESRGVTKVLKPPAPGEYHVFFDRDVSSCATIVTPTLAAIGDVSADKLQGFSNGVRVYVSKDFGTGDAFSLAVLC
jgi:hypothetical protein